MANRNGNVKVCITNPEKLKEVSTYQHKIYLSAKGLEIGINDLPNEKPDLIIDAVIGYNLKSAPRGYSLEMINWANSQPAKILSLDVPSGVNTTTGDTPDAFIKAERTLTLALPKIGLLPELTGDLYLADIWIPIQVYNKTGINYKSPFGGKFIVKLI